MEQKQGGGLSQQSKWWRWWWLPKYGNGKGITEEPNIYSTGRRIGKQFVSAMKIAPKELKLIVLKLKNNNWKLIQAINLLLIKCSANEFNNEGKIQFTIVLRVVTFGPNRTTVRPRIKFIELYY